MVYEGIRYSWTVRVLGTLRLSRRWEITLINGAIHYMTKALITAAAFAALFLAGPVNAAQTSGARSDNSAAAYEPGQQKGSAKKYAPGQRKKPGESARKYAPGQRKKPGESARDYAPGQLKKKPTKDTDKYADKPKRSDETSGATGAIKKKVQKSY
jgi:hypothetical protein